MQHGIGVVADAEQKHLAVHRVHTADRAVRRVRRKRERSRRYPLGPRPGRSERERVITSHNAGHLPENLGHHTKVY